MKNLLWFFLVSISLLFSCAKKDSDPNRVDFTIDLNDVQYSDLSNLGGKAYYNQVIIVRDATGNYDAVAKDCSYHLCQLDFDVAMSNFTCPCLTCHFDLNGAVTMGPATISLTKFLTQKNGNYLRVYSN